ncbi:MAG TPA: DUF2786 domain-containing protein [Bacteroidales bacterium]|jgi:hypothetical protein|nr:DUF2786 domain-containing protein [bacterium]HQI44851.1 DUF2786 domain-containing protein [Bacteroidales bacterium]
MSDTYIKKLAKLKINRINPDAENDIEHRVSNKIEEIEKNKKGLLIAADEYGKKYREEILDGTEKRVLLLREGKDKGLTEEETMAEYGKFLPSIYSPILNFIYFSLREMEEKDAKKYELRDELNKQIGHLREEDIENTILKVIPKLEEFLYGDVTFDMFEKIKKLKALSRSENKNEAFMAYTKAMELCKEHGLDFDKIPCNVK